MDWEVNAAFLKNKKKGFRKNEIKGGKPSLKKREVL
jgi:hypothetical protein